MIAGTHVVFASALYLGGAGRDEGRQPARLGRRARSLPPGLLRREGFAGPLPRLPQLEVKKLVSN